MEHEKEAESKTPERIEYITETVNLVNSKSRFSWLVFQYQRDE